MRLSLTWRIVLTLAVLTAATWGQSASSPQSGQSRSVAIVIDDSKSAGNHQAEIQKDVQRFLKFFTADDELCIYAAKEKPMLWQEFTSDTDLLSKSVTKLYGRGKLALYDTILAAARHLQNEAGNEAAALVVFTAGDDNASSIKVPDLLSAIKVPVYLVVGPETDWRTQEPVQVLAHQYGGRAYFARSTDEMLDLSRQVGWRITGRSDTALAASAGKPLAPFKVLVVPSIPVANSKATEQVSGGDNVLLHRVLVSRLRKSKLFTEVIDAGDADASTPVPANSLANGRLELLATVTGFQQGSRARRALLPFGGGTKLTVQVVLRDAGSPQPLLGFVKEGSASSGMLGGSDEKIETEAIIRAADEIVAELRKNK